MARGYSAEIGNIVKKIGFILLTAFVLRTVFLFANYNYFSDLDKLLLLRALIYSIRIDIATLLLINTPLLLFLTGFPGWFHKWKRICTGIFLLVNGFVIFLFVSDNIYFTYTQNRISYDTLFLVPQSFTPKLLVIYCKQGWYWILLMAAVVYLYIKIFGTINNSVLAYHLSWANRLLGAVIISAICVMGVRGFESRPLSPSTILLHFPSKIIYLSSNTTFNLLYAKYKGQRQLPDKNYFTTTELDKRFQIFHQRAHTGNINKPNVVLMVMESFARDYLDHASKFKAATPFLDSLMGKGLVFRNAFNNGRESTHGLVAILASLPPFMQVPYYHSQYHATSIPGIGKILTENGYDCSFFLGDVDDSFGFRAFTQSIGIDHYYGRKDFDDDRFYNGAWGIHDENFFLYAAEILSQKQPPFFSTIYNVSSHPPYIIPDHLRQRFTINGQSPAQNSVSYVDYAYQSFFEKIRNEKWFNNTVFIFVADHFLSPSDKKQFTSENINEIPFFIYAPGMPLIKGSRDYVVQQLDVVPTILQLAGYPGRFMSFGKTVLEENQPRFAVQKMDYIFQIIDSSYALGLNADNDSVMYLFNYRADSLLRRNLFRDTLITHKKVELESHLKAMIQRYNDAFNNNRLLF